MPTESWKQKTLRHFVSFFLTFFSAAIVAFAISFDAALAAGEMISGTLLWSSAFGGMIAGVRAILKILREIKY